jgi:FkbM family methyltransferase
MAKISRMVLRLARLRAIDASVAIFSPKDRPDLKFTNCRSMNYRSIIDQRIYWLGIEGWDLQCKHWKNCCAQSNRILEIGANIGGLTVIGAKAAPNTPFLAVEPHPVSAKLLRRNLELNCLTNVEVIEKAVVGRTESKSAKLMVRSSDPGDTPTGAYLAAGQRESRDRAVRDMVEVELVEASDLMDQVDLLKVDVEGLEFDILSSVAEIVAHTRPTIFVEVLEKSPKLRSLLLSWRDSYGYRIYIPGRADLQEVPFNVLEGENFQIFQRAHRTRDVILIAE